MNTKKNFVNLIAGIMAALTIMSFTVALPTYANSKHLTPHNIEAAFEAPVYQLLIFRRKNHLHN